jgi:hypothetical protein
MMATSRSATKWRDEAIIQLIERIGRERDLHPDESAMLHRAVRRLKPKRAVWRWSEAEDRAIRELLSRRPIRLRYVRYAKPFQRNDEVRALAEKLGRSEWAIYRRMERLRKRAKCSDARKSREG